MSVGLGSTLGEKNRLAGSAFELSAGEIAALAHGARSPEEGPRWRSILYRRLAGPVGILAFALLCVPIAAARRGGRAFGSTGRPCWRWCEGRIWMNTQRPEWNDANNALVGKGLSVVTLAYLRRMVVFCQDLLEQSGIDSVEVSAEIKKLFLHIFDILNNFRSTLARSFSDEQRRSMMDGLGQAGSDYRWNYYSNGLSGGQAQLKMRELTAFLELTQQFVEHSLRANKRGDSLYHAYNILHLGEGKAAVGHLYEMLEGQVAILSSGMLSGEESLALLESMRNSPLYRADQQSYILYPDRVLPGFIEKNTVKPGQVSGLGVVAELAARADRPARGEARRRVSGAGAEFAAIGSPDRARELRSTSPSSSRYTPAR